MNTPTELPLLQRTAPFALPVRVLQFGQGNFLRGFVDWQLDLLNERCGFDIGVVIVRPTTRSTAPLLDTQGGCYTTVLRGLDEAGVLRTEVRRIQCVQRELDLACMYGDYLALAANPDVRFIISNTTEAGIAVNVTDRYADEPPTTFPAKLTRWLHARFVHFDGEPARGLILLPCELIEANGPALRQAVLHYADLWQLEPAFHQWIDQSCHFCSTLVDRIVTGYPSDDITALQAELGYRDDFLVTGELYHYWAIEAPDGVARELPLQRAGLQVEWVDTLAPIRLRKVAILNGAHTLLAPLGLLKGKQTVGEAMADPELRALLEAAVYEEIIPALPFEPAALQGFTVEVFRRFCNPHISHRLDAIALNSWSKFATRLMPQIVSHQRRFGRLPSRLVLALAAMLHLQDAEHVTAACADWRATAVACLERRTLWDEDLNGIAGFTAALSTALLLIAEQGIGSAVRQHLRIQGRVDSENWL